MKKYFLGMIALVFVAAASAFALQDKSVETTQQDFHWFTPNGQYLGELTRTEADMLCPGSGQVCATPYSAIIGEEGEEEPVGDPAGLPVQKQ